MSTAPDIWPEELTTPYCAFRDAGANVTLALIEGGSIPVDQRSVAPDGENDASVELSLKDAELQSQMTCSPRFDVDFRMRCPSCWNRA